MPLDTMSKLDRYTKALQTYNRRKFTFDSNVRQGLVNKKPLESEPMPDAFWIDRADTWALKIRNQILGVRSKIPGKKV